MNNFSKGIMSLSRITPGALLSSASREQCVTKLNELPVFVKNAQKKKQAAVLVPLCVVDDEVSLLFTLRSSNLSTHSGQVSFPGGKMDKDESVFDTALRETEEEIGISPQDIDIWGKMCTVQGRDASIVITPVVGVLKNFDLNKLKANEHEVADIFTVPMKVFCDQNNHGSFTYNKIVIPVFLGGKHRIWGITGLMTHLFLQCFLPNEVYEPDFEKKVFQLDELMPSKL